MLALLHLLNEGVEQDGFLPLWPRTFGSEANPLGSTPKSFREDQSESTKALKEGGRKPETCRDLAGVGDGEREGGVPLHS